MSMSLTIPRRFRGPHNSGNGGYSCGLLAAFVPGPTEVTLRQPPPLDRALRVEVGPPVAAYDGELRILEARPGTVEVDLPTPPSFAEATARSRHYTGLVQHALPECFTCGPDRAEGDGMRIFAGRSAEGQAVAAPWVPHPSLTDGRQAVGAPVLWAALDCPGYFAVAAPGELALLGRMTARIAGSVDVGERCVVMGWSLGREGRKLKAATALKASFRGSS